MVLIQLQNISFLKPNVLQVRALKELELSEVEGRKGGVVIMTNEIMIISSYKEPEIKVYVTKAILYRTNLHKIIAFKKNNICVNRQNIQYETTKSILPLIERIMSLNNSLLNRFISVGEDIFNDIPYYVSKHNMRPQPIKYFLIKKSFLPYLKQSTELNFKKSFWEKKVIDFIPLPLYIRIMDDGVYVRNIYLNNNYHICTLKKAFVDGKSKYSILKSSFSKKKKYLLNLVNDDCVLSEKSFGIEVFKLVKNEVKIDKAEFVFLREELEKIFCNVGDNYDFDKYLSDWSKRLLVENSIGELKKS